MAASKLQALWNHPAGPKTIHFWAPTCKWCISIANVADFSKPPEMISYPQQIAVTFTGLVWSRYSLVIKPAFTNLHAKLGGISLPDSLLFVCMDGFVINGYYFQPLRGNRARLDTEVAVAKE